MNRWITLCLLTLSLSVTPVWAQDATNTDTDTSTLPVVEKKLVAEAGPDVNVAVGRNVLFNASASSAPGDVEVTYTWDFGDGNSTQGIDATHIYDQPGTYKVKLVVTAGDKISRDSLLVYVAEDVVLLLVDDSVSREDVRAYTQYAQRNGTLLVPIQPRAGSELDYVLARNLAEQLVALDTDLSQAKVILVWTKSTIGLNALSEVGQIINSSGSGTSSNISFTQKAIVQISDSPNSGALGRIAQTTYNSLLPTYVLLTTPASVNEIIANPEANNLTERLQTQSVPYQLIGQHSQRALEQLSPLNFMSFGVNYLINKGVSQDTIFLLLALPVVATIIAFGRQVIGVKAFGIYVPSIMTLSFMVTGFRYGVLVFLVLLAAATLARIAARRLRILYLPRMAIVLTLVSLAIVVMFLAAGYFNLPGVLSLSIFPILVMMILTEKFVEVQIEQGNKAAIILTSETLGLAMISYFIVTWGSFQTLLLGYPELILLTIVINILLGRFSGLRVVEYFRFRRLLKTDQNN